MLNSNRMVLMAAAAMDIQGDDDEDLKKIMTQNNICWPVFSPVHPHQPDIFGIGLGYQSIAMARNEWS